MLVRANRSGKVYRANRGRYSNIFCRARLYFQIALEVAETAVFRELRRGGRTCVQ